MDSSVKKYQDTSLEKSYYNTLDTAGTVQIIFYTYVPTYTMCVYYEFFENTGTEILFTYSLPVPYVIFVRRDFILLFFVNATAFTSVCLPSS